MVLGEPYKLYVHVFVMLLFCAIVIIFVRRFVTSKVIQEFVGVGTGGSGVNVGSSSTSMISNFTVMCCSVPSHVDGVQLKKVFEDLFPMQVAKVEIVKNVRYRLMLEKKYEYCQRKLEHYQALNEIKGKRVKMSNLCGSDLCNLNTCVVDPIEYYTNLKTMIQYEIESLDCEKPTGYAFVVFKSVYTAEQCKEMYKKINVVIDSRPVSFKVKRAHEPDDIIWPNLCMSQTEKNFRTAIVYLIVAVLLIFFSTPLAIVSSIQEFANSTPAITKG
jgi:hypothetical protein